MPLKGKNRIKFDDARTNKTETLTESAFAFKVRTEKLICIFFDDDKKDWTCWCPSVWPQPVEEFLASIDKKTGRMFVDDMNNEENSKKVLSLKNAYEEEKQQRICAAKHLLEQAEQEAAAAAAGGDTAGPTVAAPTEDTAGPTVAAPTEDTAAPTGDTDIAGTQPPEEALSKLSLRRSEAQKPSEEDEWSLVVPKSMQKSEGPKLVTMLDIYNLLMGLMGKVDTLENTLKTVKDNLKTVEDTLTNEVKRMEDNLSMQVNNLSTQVNNLKDQSKKTNFSLSKSFERSCRSSYCLFLEGRLGVKASPPILAKKIPYFACKALENVAVMCLKHNKTFRDVPDLVEIDVIVHLNKRYSSPPRLSSMRGTWGQLAIGEVCQSGFLCSEPEKFGKLKVPIYSATSKLLFKFVQVERGLIAAKDYYQLDDNDMFGAAIMSPSFKALSQPDELVSAVLRGHTNAFRHVSRLHANNCMWLLDI